MHPFEFVSPTRILFGHGKLAELTRAAPALGKSCLVVTGKSSARRIGLLERVMERLTAGGVKGIIFNHVAVHARTDAIDEAAQMVRAAKIEFILAVGGGSTMDMGKAVALLAANDGPAVEYASAGGPPRRKPRHALPVATLPTTAGSGSEVSQTALLVDAQAKRQYALVHAGCWPRFCIVDPDAAGPTPAQVTARAGVLPLAAALEAMSLETPSLSEEISAAVCRSTLRMLPVAIHNAEHPEARAELAWASLVTGTGVAGCGGPALRPVRELARVIAGRTDLSWGPILAILLPGWLRLLREVNPEPVARIGVRLFDLGYDAERPAECADRTVTALESWFAGIGMPTRFSDYSMGEDQFAEWVSGLGQESPNFYAALTQLLGSEIGEPQMVWMLQTRL